MTNKLQKTVQNLPHQPGIYQFFDQNDQILYVGKAIDLKNRVSSYFQKSAKLLPKTRMMVGQIKSLKPILVESEMEALLLEAELIKQKKPKYNHILKDDKSYLYIVFTAEKFPRIMSARKNHVSENKSIFGPFPSSQIVYTTLKEIRKIFAYRSCTPWRFTKHSLCLYYHLHLCQGPCVGIITEKAYFQEIQKLRLLLQRKSSQLLKNLRKQMQELAQKEEFEKASLLRDQMEKLNYLRSSFHTPTEYLQEPNLLEDLRVHTLQGLQKVLNLSYLPQRIECYDISNFQGKEATGSMVVFTNGEMDKSQYRRFRIKFSETPDDYSMLQEVLSRRFKRIKTKESWPIPNLIMVDGGAGQLSAALEIVKNLNHLSLSSTTFISLAKKKEEIYLSRKINQEQGFSRLKLSRKSPELQLLQQIRDEAHRFAIAYHRKLRTKKLFSVL